MSESPRNPESSELECPSCGKLLARVGTSDGDNVLTRRVEYQCPNGHSIVVERHEILVDRDDVE
jgi:predicted RNA-binding Zn-ribbon protein involved in translation (DUF1610 family)